VTKHFYPLDRNVTEEDRTKFYNLLQGYGGAVGFTRILRPKVSNEELIVPGIEDIVFSEGFMTAENH
jgi:hypothetical protein